MVKLLPVPFLLGWNWLKQHDVIISPGTDTAILYGQPALMALEDLSDPDPIFVNLAKPVEIQPTSMVQVKVYIKDQALKHLTKFGLA